MKKAITTLLLLTTFCVFHSLAAADVLRGKRIFRQGHAPGRLMIKLKRQAALQMFSSIRTNRAGRVLSGLSSLDSLHRRHRIRRMFRSHKRLRRLQMAQRLGSERWYVLEVDPNADIERLAAAYRLNRHVAVAKPDYLLYRTEVPNDPNYLSNWGHNNTGQLRDYCWGCGGHAAGVPVGTPGFDASAEFAWDQGFGDSNVIIAIIDSGVDTGHPDLNLVAGYDFGDNDGNPDDNSAFAGHGTACAGVAAAISDNYRGVVGIAGGSRVMPLKVANSQGFMYASTVADALYYAADNGADVASMSLGAPITGDPQVDPALEYAYEAGVTIFASAGNANHNAIDYPARSPYVIAVGAASPCGDRKRSSSDSSEVNPGVVADPRGYTCDGERWWGSSYGSTVQDAYDAIDVLAPTILPTTDITGAGGYDSGDYYLWFSGTSCATPYAAGVAALIKAHNPDWTPAQIRERLVATATDIRNAESAVGWDRYSGYGLVNAALAVGEVNTPPVAEANGPYSGDADSAIVFSSAGSNDPDGAIVAYWWDFGDGYTSTAANPSHVYASGGTYEVSLTVTDEDGVQATDTTSATVIASLSHITEESEPNNNASGANGSLGIGVDVSGYLSRYTTDWFYIDVTSAGPIEIVLNSIYWSDLDWFLYDANMTELARGYTTSNPERGGYYVTKPGRYYLEVDGYWWASGAYTLTVTR